MLDKTCKNCDHTMALEGRVSTMENYWTELRRDVKYIHTPDTNHAALLEDMENRLRRNNMCAVSIYERQRGRPCHFY